MLDVIRRNAGSWLLKVILGAIVVVFVFWGVGTFRSQRLSIIASVNGEDILQGEYQQAYAQAVERYSKMFGGSIPEGLLKQLNIKQQVLNNLINEALIRQAAAKMGIRVSEEEIKSVILTFPNFKRNGVFDKRLYDMALREAHLTPLTFEAMIRQQLLTDKLREVLFSGIIVTDPEVKEFYKFQNEEIELAMVKVPSSSCEEDVNASETALKGWYDAHKSDYETMPEIKVRFVKFSKDKVLKGVKVSDDAIRSYYDTNKKEFEVKERRRARHILVRVPLDADNATLAEKRRKAEEILKEAKSGKDFAELAKKYSEDPGSAKSGGDLGFFTKEMMVKPFSDKVFTMKEGEIAGPVRTRFGFHIIKLEKIEPGRTKGFDEVKAEIAKKLKTKKANDILWETANKAYDEIITLGGLDDYAKEANMTIQEAGPFSRNEPPPVIGFSKETLDALFSLEKGELSSLLPVPGGIIIAEVVDKIPPTIPPFEKVRERVKKDYVRHEAETLCQKKAQALLEKARAKGVEEAAKEYGLSVKNSGFFSRATLSKLKGVPNEVAKAGLSLYEEKPLPDQVIRVGKDFYVIALKGRKAPDMKGLTEDEEKKIRTRLLTKKRNEAFEQWLTYERQKAEIKVLRNI